jgi:PAS domain S-box-containing protein
MKPFMENKNITILAIDDIQDNLISLKALIRESFPDALIFTALSGAKGLEIASEKDPDVILLDIVMPEMDGFEVCKRLKANPKLIDIPVVFVTALKGDKDSRIYALECGAEAFLAKPIDPSELTAQIRAMVKIKIAKIDKRDEKERLTRMVEEQTRDLRASELAAKNLLYSLRKEIEQKKKNDEILKKSEENYKNLIEHSPNIIYRYSSSKGGIFWSDRVKDILGFTQIDLLNDPFLWNNSIHPDDKLAVQKAIEDNNNGVDFNIDYRIKTKDGRWIWLNDIFMHKYSVGDEIIIEGIATDITARKHAEEALQNALMRYQIFFEHTGSSNSIFDINCCLILQNKESIAQLGLSPEEAVGKSVYELFGPTAGEAVYKRMKRVLDTGKSETFDTQFDLQTGIKWFTSSYQALHDEYNKVIGIQVISHDITENKQREALQSLSSDIIDILNSEKDTTEIFTEILYGIKRVTKFSAMGIRFKTGEDYPFITTLGFTDEFLHKENSLLVQNKKHDICRDINGQPMLGCTCGMVITGKYNASESSLTKTGTFWTNNSNPLLDLTIDDEPRFNPRNTCIQEGYGSIAIIPIKAKELVVGTLQLNEQRTNAFTEDMIHFFEAICLNIGNTLMRKQAQKKLEQSEEKFSKLFKSSPDAILLTQLSNGTLVDFNDVVCSISGYQRKELLGQSMQTLNLWADISERNLYIENLIKARNVSNYEVNVRLKSGEVRIGLLSAEIITLDGEEFILAVIRDISDRKKAENLLKESREKFAAVFDFAPVMISIADFETGTFIETNNYATQISEFSRDEIIGNTAANLDWITVDDRKLMLQHILEKGKIENLEITCKTKSGKEIIGIVNGQKIIINNKDCLLTITTNITDRKIIENKLVESYQFNNQIIKSAHEGIIVYDLDLRFQVWNQFMENLTGLPASEIIGHIAQEKFPFLQDEGVIAILKKARKGEIIKEHVLPFHFPVSRKTGWVADTVSPLRNFEGEIIGVITIVQDITQRKRFEEAIRRSEAIQYKMVANISDVLAIIDKNGNNTYKSPNIEKWFGWKPEELIGKSAFELVHTDDLPAIQLFFGSIITKPNATAAIEFRYLCKNGLYTWVKFTGINLLHDPDIKGILGNYHDISKRKQNEDKVKESENKYRSLVETAQELVWKCDSNGCFIYLNPAWEKTHGYSIDEMLGKNFGDFQSPEVFERDIKEFARHMAGGSVKEYETTQIAKDGRLLTLLFNAIPLFDIDGNVIGTQGTAIDITERKHAEEKAKKEQANLLAIVENSRNGMWSVNNEFCLIRSNEAFIQYAKDIWEVDIYDGISMLSFLPTDEIIEYNQLYSLALSGESVSVIKNAFISNQNFYYEISFNPINVEGKIIGISCRLQDITQRIIDEQTILRRTQELRLLIDSSLDYIFSIDKVYRIVTCNKSFRGGVNSIIGRPPLISESILFPEMGKDIKDQWQDVFEHVLAGESIHFESEPKWFNNKTIILSSDLNPIYDMQGDVIGVVGVVRDITQSKLVERRILNATIEAEERERNHFARELHEGLGPILSVIKLYFQWLHKPNIHTSKETLMENIQATIADAIATTKEISYKLSPHVLENFGIGNAVTGFIEKITAHNTLHFSFECTLTNRIEKDIEISIYRVITECINNTVKYANAQNVSISLSHENETLYLSYSDDGIGFDQEKRKEQASGLGLINMQNRITMLGGTFIIRTAIGKGFSVYIDLPAKYISQNE